MKEPVLIIAEAGVNHNGSLAAAKQLIDVAAAAGADYVKFQTFRAEKVASRFARMADYQVKNTGQESDQLALLRKLELSESDHVALRDYCRDLGIQFLSTAFDAEGIHMLRDLGVTLGKIPSGEITNLPYLRTMARTFDRLLLSTGMADEAEIAAAVDVLVREGVPRNNITILHCNTEYPTPFEDANLRAIPVLAERFQCSVGYSDHTLGIEAPIAAVTLGATVIEKHFTLDRTLEGPDHRASLEPIELMAMVSAIRNIELAMAGTGEKKPTPSEQKNIVVARRSIVAAVPIAAGETFTEENLTTKRPANGLSPMLWDEVLGKAAKRDFSEDEAIEL